MYADRYGRPTRLDPGALALALGGTAFFLFGLSLTAPHFMPLAPPALRGYNVDLPVPPKPKDPPPPQPRQKDMPTRPTPRPDRVEVTHPPVQPTPGGDTMRDTYTPSNLDPIAGGGSGGDLIPLAPIHVPVDIAPQLDSRYAAVFQPDYPLGERQAEHAGRVVVRVLIGIDGRVKAVEQVSAASPAFFEATRKRALEKWRFKPGTRDGTPVEAWRTVGVTFQIENE